VLGRLKAILKRMGHAVGKRGCIQYTILDTTNNVLGKVYEHQINATITSSFMNLAFTPKVKSLVELTFAKHCKVGFN
jgi:hypothetical protein